MGPAAANDLAPEKPTILCRAGRSRKGVGLGPELRQAPSLPNAGERQPAAHVQITVINLAADTARRAMVSRQFQRAGLKVTWQTAVAGDDLLPEDRDSLYSERLNQTQYHQPLRGGEIGCYASHVMTWKRMLASGQAYMAIFEDDIEIDPELGRVLETIARTPVQWDLIKLTGRRDELVRSRAPLGRDHELIAYQRLPSLTGGYVLSHSGAQKLIAHRVPFGRPVDVDLRHWWECDLDVLGVQPYPVRGAATSRRTTISGRRDKATLRSRLKKLYLQARYTLMNGLAAPYGASPGTALHDDQRAGDLVAPRDAA